MNPIKLKHEDGETIEMKWDADGNIQLWHSDLGRKKFGRFHEYAKKMRQPQVEAFFKEKGIDATSPQARELLEKMGGYLNNPRQYPDHKCE